MAYPKRLIEVDLPIRRISAHARREKSIRHGHISTLHIWWARRPLAACRAVVCASLWPDPGDELCPAGFVAAARRLMRFWADEALGEASQESYPRFVKISKRPECLDDADELRQALLDFLADFANWDNSTKPNFLAVARALTAAAHDGLEGIGAFRLPDRISVGTLAEAIRDAPRPLLVDPFAGGGAIPLEALRCGADAFASDLNPVAVLLNKVVLEYIPKYGQRLADEVEKWGKWIQQEAEKELAPFYPKDPDGATPIAYLWARTIRCEGPGCGAEVPLMRSKWLCKKAARSTAMQIVPNPAGKRCDFVIIRREDGRWIYQDEPSRVCAKPDFGGTVIRGSATCPCCGYTTPVVRVRAQLKTKHGGANDARLFCVVTTRCDQPGRLYRLPDERDLRAVQSAQQKLEERKAEHVDEGSLVPEEALDLRGIRHTWGMIYGLDQWSAFFTARQLLALTTLARLIREAACEAAVGAEEAAPVRVVLALALSRLVDRCCAICTWRPQADQEKVEHAFARQAIPMTWDFAEGMPLTAGTAGWRDAYMPPCRLIGSLAPHIASAGSANCASATHHPLPDDLCHALVTDPPYYDAVPYSYLSDFFYVWLKRCLIGALPNLFIASAVPKDDEVVVDRPHEQSHSTHDIAYYEQALTQAFGEGRRILQPPGIGVVVFASKTTASWEAILKAVVDAGWTITGSWPIDTEMETRVAAQGQARLASSVHLVCRPREDESGRVVESVGDWRDVLAALPRRIAEWLPRLAAEGVVGADAIFSCLGPALEIFSRHSSVEKASGERVELREYLELVWAEVARQALAMVFEGADASAFEEDARLTAMWFWTLRTGPMDADAAPLADDEEEAEDEDTTGRPDKTPRVAGYPLEYDAARKIAPGPGLPPRAVGPFGRRQGHRSGPALRPLPRRPPLRPRPGGRAPPPARRRETGPRQLEPLRPARTRHRRRCGARAPGTGPPPRREDRPRPCAPVHAPLLGRPQRRPLPLPCRGRHRRQRPVLDAGASPFRPVSYRQRRETLGRRRPRPQEGTGILGCANA